MLINDLYKKLILSFFIVGVFHNANAGLYDTKCEVINVSRYQNLTLSGDIRNKKIRVEKYGTLDLNNYAMSITKSCQGIGGRSDKDPAVELNGDYATVKNGKILGEEIDGRVISGYRSGVHVFGNSFKMDGNEAGYQGKLRNIVNLYQGQSEHIRNSSEGNGSRIINMKITATHAGIYVMPFHRHVVIEGNEIRSGGHGVYLGFGGRNNVIENNIFSLYSANERRGGDNYPKDAIAVDGNRSTRIAHNKFTRAADRMLNTNTYAVNIYHNCGEQGIKRYDQPYSTTIANNSFDGWIDNAIGQGTRNYRDRPDCVDSGFHDYSSGTVIQDNYISNPKNWLFINKNNQSAKVNGIWTESTVK